MEKLGVGFTPFVLIIGDIDHFKRINDTYGHPAGDAVLKQVGQTWGQFPEKYGGFTCRYGGEECVWILPNTALEEGIRFAELIRKSLVNQSFSYGELVTMSFGVARYPNHSTTASGVLSKADEALYQAKQAGRNRVISFVL